MLRGTGKVGNNFIVSTRNSINGDAAFNFPSITTADAAPKPAL
jgi:hypothetical protein